MSAPPEGTRPNPTPMASRCTIDSLPNELLSEIFGLVSNLAALDQHCPELYLSRTRHCLTSLNRRWNAVAMSTPALWSTIFAMLSGSLSWEQVHESMVSKCPEQTRTMCSDLRSHFSVRALLNRSRNHPLDIQLTLFCVDGPQHATLDLLWSVCNRWHSLDLMDSAPTRIGWSTLLDRGRFKFPCLTRATLHISSRRVGEFFTQSPNLRSIELGGSGSILPRTAFFRQVTEVIVPGGSTENSQLLKQICRFPNVRTVRLSVSYQYLVHVSGERYTLPSSCHSLVLAIDSDVDEDMFDNQTGVRGPSVTSITIIPKSSRATNFPLGSLASFVRLSQCRLTHLSIENVSFFWSDLDTFLRACPIAIIHLTLKLPPDFPYRRSSDMATLDRTCETRLSLLENLDLRMPFSQKVNAWGVAATMSWWMDRPALKRFKFHAVTQRALDEPVFNSLQRLIRKKGLQAELIVSPFVRVGIHCQYFCSWCPVE